MGEKGGMGGMGEMSDLAFLRLRLFLAPFCAFFGRISIASRAQGA